jgi:FkbM family methyltransferase
MKVINKVFRKIFFIIRIIKLGANVKARFILLYEVVLVQMRLYFGGSPKPYECELQNKNKKILVSFRGTLDELHALTEIFVERCYDTPRQEATTILDLGANIGIASLWMHTEFPQAIIHSYEPDPEVFKVLKKNMDRILSAKAYNVAVADHIGTLEFYSSERSFSSSIYSVPSSKKIKVATTTIDQAVLHIGGAVDILKIDIEGAEFSAFEVANNLRNVSYIIGEIHPEKAKRDTASLVNSLSKTHKIRNLGSDKTLFQADLLS